MTTAAAMTTDTIIANLTGTVEVVGLPRETILAATAQRAELVPRFLREIETFTLRPAEWVDDGSLLFFAVHLLGEWREQAAYMPLMQLLRVPDDRLHAPFGDSKTESLPRVVAAVFDGDPLPIFEAIHDAKANEFVRWELFSTLAILVREERLERSRVIDFLRNCFTTLPQATEAIWCGWQDAISRLAVHELEPLVRQAFEKEFICPTFCEFAEFKTDLDDALKVGTAVAWQHNKIYTSFGSVIEEMADWYCFKEGVTQRKAHNAKFDPDDIDDDVLMQLINEFRAMRALEPQTFAPAPETNEFRHIGRNDPCPCDSGKKYKKCCLN
jgi:Protein of unknown function (DUF1186)/SEC-C motif